MPIYRPVDRNIIQVRSDSNGFIDNVSALRRRQAVDGSDVLWRWFTDGAVHEHFLQFVKGVGAQICIRKNGMVVIARYPALEGCSLQLTRYLGIAQWGHDVIRQVRRHPEGMTAAIYKSPFMISPHLHRCQRPHALHVPKNTRARRYFPIVSCSAFASFVAWAKNDIVIVFPQDHARRPKPPS